MAGLFLACWSWRPWRPWRPWGRPCSLGFGGISVASGAAAGGFALTATHFSRRRNAGPAKSKQKALPLAYGTLLRLSVPSLRCPSGGIAYGLLRCTSSRCMRLRRTALRASPLMNTYARPAEGAKAKAKADQKIAAFGSFYSGCFQLKKLVGCQAAIASRASSHSGIWSIQQETGSLVSRHHWQSIASICTPPSGAAAPLKTMSASSRTAFDLDPRATSEG